MSLFLLWISYREFIKHAGRAFFNAFSFLVEYMGMQDAWIGEHHMFLDSQMRFNVLYHVKDLLMMPPVGVEPTCLSAHDFESCVSANSTTAAYFYFNEFKYFLPIPLLRNFSLTRASL